MLVGQGVEGIGILLSDLEIQLDVAAGPMPARLPAGRGWRRVTAMEGGRLRNGFHLVTLLAFCRGGRVKIADVDVLGKNGCAAPGHHAALPFWSFADDARSSATISAAKARALAAAAGKLLTCDGSSVSSVPPKEKMARKASRSCICAVIMGTLAPAVPDPEQARPDAVLVRVKSTSAGQRLLADQLDRLGCLGRIELATLHGDDDEVGPADRIGDGHARRALQIHHDGTRAAQASISSMTVASVTSAITERFTGLPSSLAHFEGAVRVRVDDNNFGPGPRQLASEHDSL